MTEKKTMYYCCYQNCYFYSVRLHQDLIHYVEDYNRNLRRGREISKTKYLNTKGYETNYFSKSSSIIVILNLITYWYI